MVAFAAYFILPDFPRTTTWLTEEEKALAIWRLEEDIGEDDWIDSEHQTFWQGARMAFTDVKTYVLVNLRPPPPAQARMTPGSGDLPQCLIVIIRLIIF